MPLHQSDVGPILGCLRSREASCCHAAVYTDLDLSFKFPIRPTIQVSDIADISISQTRAPKPSQTERSPGLPGRGATETLPPPAEGGGPTGSGRLRGHSPRLPLALRLSGTTELESTVGDMTRPKTADSRLSSETGPTRLKPRGIAHLHAGLGPDSGQQPIGPVSVSPIGGRPSAVLGYSDQ